MPLQQCYLTHTRTHTDVYENDADSQCRMLAQHTLALLDNAMQEVSILDPAHVCYCVMPRPPSTVQAQQS